jgi:hypothetical protein
MLMELCLGVPQKHGEDLLRSIYKQLVFGRNADGTTLKLQETVELMGWVPPKDWHLRIMNEAVLDGVCLPAHFTDGEGDLALPVALKKFIDNSRKEYPFNPPAGVPASIQVLACIKNVSPLPSEFWRASMFGPVNSQ